MPERIEWVVRTVIIPDPDPDEDGELPETAMFLGDWEPFAYADGYMLVKKQVMVEATDKSSAHHELSFADRYDR